MRHRHVIKRVSLHRPRFRAPILVPIFIRRQIPIQPQTTPHQKFLQLPWKHPKRPRLPDLFNIAQNPFASLEMRRTIQQSFMKIRKNNPAADAAIPDVSKHGVHRFSRQVIRNSLPQKHRRLLWLKTGLPQYIPQRAPVEIRLNKSNRLWYFRQSFAQNFLLRRQRRRMIHLKNLSACHLRKPVSPAIKSRPKNHHLPNPISQRLAHRIVNQLRPRNRRSPRPRQPPIRIRLNDPRNNRPPRSPNRPPQRSPHKPLRQRIDKQSPPLRTYRLQRPKKRHILRRPTCSVCDHCEIRSQIKRTLILYKSKSQDDLFLSLLSAFLHPSSHVPLPRLPTDSPSCLPPASLPTPTPAPDSNSFSPHLQTPSS